MIGARADLGQVTVPHFIRQPDCLERTVPLQGASGVIVNAFARPREQARRRIAVIHNHVCVGLVALQGDANDHLAKRRASDGISAAQCLRAEQHMNAEGAALPDDPIQEQRCGLRNLVILDKKFLKLIDHQ